MCSLRVQESGLKVREYELLRRNFSETGNFGETLARACHQLYMGHSSSELYTLSVCIIIMPVKAHFRRSFTAWYNKRLYDALYRLESMQIAGLRSLNHSHRQLGRHVLHDPHKRERELAVMSLGGGHVHIDQGR